jgi:hypothetical protein
MFANIQLHAGMKRQNNQFASGISRKGYSSRTRRHAYYKRHSRQYAVNATLQRHYTRPGVVVLPEQHMMLEKHGILVAKIYLGHRNDLALDLTGTATEPDLGHVLYSRSLSPTGLAHQIFYIERRSASSARNICFFIHCLAPLTLNAFDRRIRMAWWMRSLLLRRVVGRCGLRCLKDLSTTSAKMRARV